MKEKKKRIEGITLISLVITIIILLILAGVSIAMLTGENGIITQAQKAKTETENAAKNEAAIFDEYNNTLNNYINGESIPEGLEIGSEVKYNPNGTYDWQSKYCSSPEDANYQKTLNSSDGEPFNIDTWKVFDINTTTGEVLLVPEHSTDDGQDGTLATSGTVYLKGAQGYNNGVKMLNEACDALYGAPENDKITARSINIEDIEGKMTDEALATVHTYLDSGTKWGEQVLNGYTASNSYYPSIYAYEKLNGLNGTQSTSGLEMSKQIDIVESTSDEAINGEGYLQALSNIRPTQTSWYKDSNFMQNAFETTSSGMSYYDLLMPANTSTHYCYYWVASRSVHTVQEYCAFGMRYVDNGPVNAYAMFRSNGEIDGHSFGLFPTMGITF